MSAIRRGDAALEAKDFPTAITEFTNALIQNNKAFPCYIKRSMCYQRSKPPQYEAALGDAEIAVKIAMERARRELVAEAQMRRAMILYNMERYGDAEFLLQIVRKKNDKEKSLVMWEDMVKKKLSALGEGDDRATVTVKEVPDVAIPTVAELKGKEKLGDESQASSDAAKDSNGAAATLSMPTTAPTPASAIKHDYYQSIDNIYLTINAKGVSKDDATVDIKDHSVSVSFPTTGNSSYDLSLDPLFAPIDASQSSFKITNYKIEITLKKATPGQKWSSLEAGDAPTPATAANVAAVRTAASDPKPSEKPVSKAPLYPTSSRSGPKDWEKIGEEDGDEEEDEPDAFFKKLFKNADPDTKRSMMKSYQESNGTALSTNWAEVSKGPVETSPPDGMVAKKWGT